MCWFLIRCDTLTICSSIPWRASMSRSISESQINGPTCVVISPPITYDRKERLGNLETKNNSGLVKFVPSTAVGYVMADSKAPDDCWCRFPLTGVSDGNFIHIEKLYIHTQTEIYLIHVNVHTHAPPPELLAYFIFQCIHPPMHPSIPVFMHIYINTCRHA